MTDHEIDLLVEAANPIGERELRALALGAEERALCEALMLADEPEGRAGDALAVRGRAARRREAPARLRPLRGRLLVAVAVAAIVAIGLVVVSGGREPGGSGVAWAAPLVRLAEASPLLLLDAPGWRVTRADESDEVEGEMTFTPGTAPVDPTSMADARRSADLNWRRGSVTEWQRDRAKSSSVVLRRTVLGQPVQIAQYAGVNDFTAIWPDGTRALEFRARAADIAAFERLVGSLKRVDVDTWLSAMPSSVVKAANRGTAVKEMLADIPVPPGFDISALEREPTLSDRYQLGAKVTGAVSCAWLARWSAARRSGDPYKLREAVDAMQTSHRWKVLREIDAAGAWPEYIWSVADAMRDGTTDGFGKGPIEQAMASGMGCDTR